MPVVIFFITFFYFYLWSFLNWFQFCVHYVKHFMFDLRIHCRFVCVNRLSVTTSVQTGTKMCEGGIAVGLM
jgi:hypothetical protein